jgi:para-aminobenzoate synthetase component 1
LRTTICKKVANVKLVQQQLLTWAQQFREVIVCDSNLYSDIYSSYDFMLAVDAFTSIKTDSYNAFENLHQYQSRVKDWIFGYLSYDLKNDIEDLFSNNLDALQFPELFFFQPKKLFLLKGNQLEIHYLKMCDDEWEEDWEQISHQTSTLENDCQNIDIKHRISKNEYISRVSKMKEYIHRGDIYEANFCMELYAENTLINPLLTFRKLNAKSEAPFSVFFKNNDYYLISASPERYLKKNDTKIISQPIKGTSKRATHSEIDNRLKYELENNAKERSENIMIVDLVRNDLSKTATKGSVQVEELCGMYSFKQVHQMISTIVSEVEPTTSSIEIVKTTFPMGSMTGAPKLSAMKIIEELEVTKRGLYSGAVGYFSPSGDFDFNVVIRSILYNKALQYVSFSVGSAITSLADPELEYEECMLKAKAMFEVLQNN